MLWKLSWRKTKARNHDISTPESQEEEKWLRRLSSCFGKICEKINQKSEKEFRSKTAIGIEKI
jgi:hypothetical protein